MKPLRSLWQSWFTGEKKSVSRHGPPAASSTMLPDGLLEQIEPFLTEADGFCHPKWGPIWHLLETSLSPSELDAAWDRVRLRWLARVCDRLGGGYRIYRTPNFLILADSENEENHRGVGVFEKSLAVILQRLTEVAQIDEGVKMAALVFSNLDDYYGYLSHFYPEGDHPMSGGVFLSEGGLRHFVFPPLDSFSSQHVITHELTHGCLSHLSLPTWLNEAIAMRMEEVVCGSSLHVLDSETIEKVRDFFTPAKIQGFWEGASWGNQDEGFGLSYDLALLMWRVVEVDLATPSEVLLRILNSADAFDAGDSALRKYLGLGVGELAGMVLGEGDWSPLFLRSDAARLGGNEVQETDGLEKYVSQDVFTPASGSGNLNPPFGYGDEALAFSAFPPLGAGTGNPPERSQEKRRDKVSYKRPKGGAVAVNYQVQVKVEGNEGEWREAIAGVDYTQSVSDSGDGMEKVNLDFQAGKTGRVTVV